MSTISISQNINMPSFTKVKDDVLTFTNSTDKFIVLATWQYCHSGLLMYKRFYIEPSTTRVLPNCSTGEFIVDSEHYERIGKFRLSSVGCTRQYSWMELDNYDITRHVCESGSNDHKLINISTF